MPTAAAFAVGTRSVSLSLSKLITNSSRALDLLLLDTHDLAEDAGNNELAGLEAMPLADPLFCAVMS